MAWSPEQVDELKRLWGDGLSTAAIGRRLGVSKNAVVGKAHRLGLSPRPSPIRRPPEPEVLRFVGPSCQWPIGHPGDSDFHFCGAKTLTGKPYCPEHLNRAYIRNNKAADEEDAA